MTETQFPAQKEESLGTEQRLQQAEEAESSERASPPSLKIRQVALSSAPDEGERLHPTCPREGGEGGAVRSSSGPAEDASN